ncbi:hypothetical protein SAMN05444050_4679 [Afipia sp. GAS231]|nr:hypothetical protein SAMN05444050_4679 [Afipia sp. GAS231]
MTECASWHALAFAGEEWAEGREQWGGTTTGLPPVIGLAVEKPAKDHQ